PALSECFTPARFSGDRAGAGLVRCRARPTVSRYLLVRSYRLPCLCILILAGLLSAVFLFCRERETNTADWDLAQFVNHLSRHGLSFKVVPSMKNGHWLDNVLLTQNPEETWHSFQLKSRTLERIDQWHGSVWLCRVGPQADTSEYLLAWGK